MTKILHIDASSAKQTSNSRKLSAAIVAKLNPNNTPVTTRDLTDALPILTEQQIGAFFTPKDQRSDQQNKLTALSDSLVEELRAHDVIVIGVPMYNFSIPASFKLYHDLVARVGETFVYTEQGPKGLLENKKIYFAVTTGGVPIDSEYDCLSPLLKTFFGFIGITDQTFISASGLAANPESSLKQAFADIEKLAV